MQANRTFALHFDRVHCCRTRCRTTDVERTHRELRARFADRLSSDDAYSFTHVDTMATREIATVALRTHAVASSARDRRTHFHLIDAVDFQLLHELLIDKRPGGNDH